MKDSDVKDIKLNSDAFTRKWWEEHRSFFAGGSGTGKALDLWQKHCTRKIESMTADQLQAAAETCDTLRKALLLAKKKVGNKDSATKKACDAYIDVVDEFANKVALRQSEAGGHFAAEQEMLDEILNFIPLLRETGKKCMEHERWFESKVPLYQKFDKEADGWWGERERDQRLDQITKEELEVSSKMKDFGKWNNLIVNPWKATLGRVEMHKLGDSKKIKAALRKASWEYDSYIEFFGKSQDLGQDHLDLLRRLFNKMKGKRESLDEVTQALAKLRDQLLDKSFGCGSKIRQQLEASAEMRSVLKPLAVALNQGTLDPELIESALDMKTKISQIDAIAQANDRAALRLKAHVEGYIKSYGKEEKLKALFEELIKGLKQARQDFATHSEQVKDVMKVIGLVEAKAGK